jgi:hypothetical protein
LYYNGTGMKHQYLAYRTYSTSLSHCQILWAFLFISSQNYVNISDVFHAILLTSATKIYW